ncbi:DegT/DnrJ/EryC1/StrS family aminotransferase [Candidatus Woesearchaeota archaeon]|nr:DegT/DnrJ/EryC1/StrS family aminotransferase [Candidatus Woesearchaeota archaeon]
MGKEECIKQLKELTGKSGVLIVKRGNTAIRLALKLVKEIGYKEVLIQDQGGWLTYKQFCGKEKLSCIEIPTDYGLVEPKSLQAHPGSVLLINSLPGYAALQDMDSLVEVCRKNKIFIINDVSGSISSKQALVGDIIIGSFGNGKPVNLGGGGFIASNDVVFNEYFAKGTEAVDLDFKALEKALCDLDERVVFLATKRKKLIETIKATPGFSESIIHPDKEGFNVIVKFEDEKQRETLINIASDSKVEFTLCPRDIRIKDQAVCFEVKRLK